MGAISHFIEREGVATTSISLIREHTEQILPPRALWVPFYFGRPLGIPSDPDFQTGVLRAALDLLPTATEHTIADYPIEAPEESFSDTWACPVSFASPDADTPTGRLRGEVQRLRPWWEETYRSRKRSLIGASGGRPEHIESMVEFLSAMANGAPFDRVPEDLDTVPWTAPMPLLIRHVAEDVRLYYQEAAASQPGNVAPSHKALNTWIFNETALGATIIEIGKRMGEADDKRILAVRFLMIPEGFWPDGPTGPPRNDSGARITDEILDWVAGRRP